VLWLEGASVLWCPFAGQSVEQHGAPSSGAAARLQTGPRDHQRKGSRRHGRGQRHGGETGRKGEGKGAGDDPDLNPDPSDNDKGPLQLDEAVGAGGGRHGGETGRKGEGKGADDDPDLNPDPSDNDKGPLQLDEAVGAGGGDDEHDADAMEVGGLGSRWWSAPAHHPNRSLASWSRVAGGRGPRPGAGGGGSPPSAGAHVPLAGRPVRAD
jgi:hypothetical protein